METPQLGTGMRPPLRQTTLVMALAFMCVVAVLSYRATPRLNVSGHPDGTNWVLQDFRDAVYFPVVALLHGDNPYDAARYMNAYPVWFPYPLYTPVNLAMHLPFGFLPFDMAERAYYLCGLLLTLLLARLTLRCCGLTPEWASTYAVATLILLSRPGQMNLLLGQVALQGVIGVYVALYYARTRPRLAGLGLALSLFKPSFGAPLAVLMLCRGDGRAVVTGMVIAAVASAGVTEALLRAAGGLGPLLASLVNSHQRFAVQAFNAPISSPFRVDTAALLARVLAARLGHAEQLAIGSGILIVGAVALACIRVRRLSTPASEHLSAALACLTVLICTYHQAYDALLLVAPVTALAASCWLPGGRAHPSLRWVLLALLVVPAFNYLASATAIEALRIGGAAWLVTTSINGVALLVAWTLCVILALWPAAVARILSTQSRVDDRR